MRIKTFYAKTMADALGQVKADLGPDALLLSTKEIPCRTGVGGSSSGFEVVGAVDEEPAAGLGTRDTFKRKPAAREDHSHAWDESALEMDDPMGAPSTYTRTSLASSVRRNDPVKSTPPKRPTKRTTTRAIEPEAPVADTPVRGAACQGVYRDIIASGVEEWLADRLILEAEGMIPPKQRRSKIAILRSVAMAAERMISTPTSEKGSPTKRIVVFVGPTGVGKTTSMAKLAARLALQEKKKVVLMTLDGYRIGAVEQIKTYAAIMGIPFRFIDNVSDLRKAIQEHSQRDHILIDTTGRSPRDLGSLEELAEHLRISDDIDRHLVLSATTKPSDLREIVERFEICNPDHLIFTKLDETSTRGPILNELVRCRKPASYYSNGQNVPQDFHMVSREQIVDLVLNHN